LAGWNRPFGTHVQTIKDSSTVMDGPAGVKVWRVHLSQVATNTV